MRTWFYWILLFLLPTPSHAAWTLSGTLHACGLYLRSSAAPTDYSDLLPNFGGKDGDTQHAMLAQIAITGAESMPIVADSWDDVGYTKIGRHLRGQTVIQVEDEEEWADTNWARYLAKFGASLYFGTTLSFRYSIPWVAASTKLLTKTNLAVKRGLIPQLCLVTSDSASAITPLLRRPELATLREGLRGFRLTGPAAVEVFKELNSVPRVKGHQRQVPPPPPQGHDWNAILERFARRANMPWENVVERSEEARALLRLLASDLFPNLRFIEFADSKESLQEDQFTIEALRTTLVQLEQ